MCDSNPILECVDKKLSSRMNIHEQLPLPMIIKESYMNKLKVINQVYKNALNRILGINYIWNPKCIYWNRNEKTHI